MKETFQVIEEMKRAGVIADYAVAWAVGAIFYTETFTTIDIDFLVDLPRSENQLVSLEPILAWLRPRGYSEFDKASKVIIESWSVQFLPVNDELSAEALAKAQYLAFDETLNVRVVRPEYLATEALKLSRPKDFDRVYKLLGFESFDPELFIDLVERFGLEQKWTKFQDFFTKD
jgi:hypothetical protein